MSLKKYLCFEIVLQKHYCRKILLLGTTIVQDTTHYGELVTNPLPAQRFWEPGNVFSGIVLHRH